MRRGEVLIRHDTEIVDGFTLVIPRDMARHLFYRTIDTAELIANLDDGKPY